MKKRREYEVYKLKKFNLTLGIRRRKINKQQVKRTTEHSNRNKQQLIS